MSHPPRFASWLLERCLSPEHDAIVGDLEEEYQDNADYYGAIRARLIYWGQALRTIPSVLITDVIWHHIMFKNYLVIAFRNLRKHKGFSAINILGLAISMSVCLLIIALVKDQKSYDTFHSKSDRIYRVISDVSYSFGNYNMATSPGPMGPALLAEDAPIEQAVRLNWYGGQATNEVKTFEVQGLYAEPSFFDIFDFELAQGDAGTALNAPFSVILTDEVVARFFGDDDPVGKVIRREGVGDFTVTGVLKDEPYRSHLQFESLASFSTLEALETQGASTRMQDWNDASRFYTYVLLTEQGGIAETEALATALSRQYHTVQDRPAASHRLQAITEVNMGMQLSNQLGSAMPKEAVYILSFLAFILVLTAVFNYISLSVARSLKRAKEIGVRKVVGAHRTQIIRQFLSEAVLMALLALGVAIIFLLWLMPAFNGLQAIQEDIGSGVAIDFARDYGTYLLFIGFAILVGLIAGVYPAFMMSRYLPTKVLKGVSKIKGFRGLTLRKSILVFQFSLSIVGIVTTLVMFQQFSLVLKANYGFDEAQLVNIDLQGQPYETFRAELMRQPGVVQVAATSTPPVAGYVRNTTVQTEAMESPLLINYYAVDEHFLDQLRLTLIAGRNFSDAFATDADAAIVLNEMGVQQLNLGSPQEAIGKQVTFDGSEVTVIGVIENFYTQGYHRGYQPTALTYAHEAYQQAIVRVLPDDLEQALTTLEAIWKQLAPTYEFQYGFYDDQLMDRFREMRDIVSILGFVAGFVIFIACLGLLGMASYTAESRIKEVGIRKVLGANVRGIVVLLSRDYVKLVAIASVLATPLTWFLTNTLLQEFANRIELSVWYFAAGIVATLVLAVLTIGSQTIRAGLANPVNTLRNE